MAGGERSDMDHAATLMLATSLLQMPSQVRRMRAAPLPDDVVILLRIAAGDDEMMDQATAMSGQSCQLVREASAFFIEQMLLHPEADSYRVLGARPEASPEELRRNMALLLRWLHPDLSRRDGRSVFAHRVTKAWNDLKTEERRSAYDRARRLAIAKPTPTPKSPRHRQPRSQTPAPRQHSGPQYRTARHRPVRRAPQRMGFFRRVLLIFFGRVVR